MPYASDYGASRPLSAHQKLAEIACSRLAEGRGATLPPLFWKDKAWCREFAVQAQAAGRLLKIYGEAAVFAALRANPRVRSLCPAWVGDLCNVEQAKLDHAIEAAGKAEPAGTTDIAEPPRRGAARGGSVRSKLKDV